MENSPAPAPPDPRRSWRRRLLLASVALAALACAGGAWWQQQRSTLRSTVIAAYDLNVAMELAGAAVPPDVESFYFFVLQPEARDESGELADKLVQAAGEREFLGIAGADSEHNREVLLAALAIVSARDLAGLVIIYVGPPAHEAELQPLVSATGARFRFVSYRPPAAQTI